MKKRNALTLLTLGLSMFFVVPLNAMDSSELLLPTNEEVICTPQKLTVSQAKDEGFIGETGSGYLGLVVDSPSDEVKALLKETNAERRRSYKMKAKRGQVSLKELEEKAGASHIKKTAAGHYVKRKGGEWEVKVAEEE